MYLEMREINKDLKRCFNQLEEKVSKLEVPHALQGQCEKENQTPRGAIQVPLMAEITHLISEFKSKKVYDNMLTQL